MIRNYEFNALPGPDGNVEVRHEDEPVYVLSPSRRVFILGYIDLLKSKKPIAYDRLYNRFIASRNNRPFHEFLIVRRHIRCNFSAFDNKMDIDENGVMHTEFSLCPHCSECEDYGIVCNSSETVLLKSEINVLRLIIDGHTTKEISELLFLSEHTVHNHRNNMMKRLNLTNTAALVKYWFENELK